MPGDGSVYLRQFQERSEIQPQETALWHRSDRQIIKSFRNEITLGNFTFRTREFEQMEAEFFVKLGTDEEWLDKWVKARFKWYIDYGIRPENLRLREHGGDELAHYAKACFNIKYRFPLGWAELEGIANRCDFDIRSHQESSGQDLSYFDESA